LEQSFAARMPLLTATSVFVLGNYYLPFPFLSLLNGICNYAGWYKQIGRWLFLSSKCATAGPLLAITLPDVFSLSTN